MWKKSGSQNRNVQQAPPRDWLLLLGRIGLDIGKLGRFQLRVLARAAVKHQPRHNPDDIEQAGDDEGAAPSHRQRNHRHDHWRDDRAHVGPGIEDADGKRPLAAGEPIARRGERRRVRAGFAERENDAHERETAR